MRVLVVDDSPSVRERLAAMIAGVAGIEAVAQASDGVEAMEAIATTSPDLLVLDIRMPRMNGFEVLHALACLADAPPSIVVSSHAEYARHALVAGARFFFDKSTQLDDLVATLRELAAGREKEP